ncbi:hypothetical protein ACHAQA_007558 [Verticillium albo-atrum]
MPTTQISRNPPLTGASRTPGGWCVNDGLAESGLTTTSHPTSFFQLAGNLKKVKRKAWSNFGIELPESVADHSQRMALMALMTPPNLDKAKCIQLCLLHDITEALIGEVKPGPGVPHNEEIHRRAAVIMFIAQQWGAIGISMQRLWLEYESKKTPESQFAQDVEKLETMMQAADYERESGLAVDLGGFFVASGELKNPTARSWGEQIIEDREKLWGDKNHIRGDLGPLANLTPDISESPGDSHH